jgi:hypothetical protein
VARALAHNKVVNYYLLQFRLRLIFTPQLRKFLYSQLYFFTVRQARRIPIYFSSLEFDMPQNMADGEGMWL